jgi:hypothetical protein
MCCYTTMISRRTCRSGFERDALSNVILLSNRNAAESINEAKCNLAAPQSLVRSTRLRHETDGASRIILRTDEKQRPSSHLVRTVRKNVASWQMKMAVRPSDGGRLASSFSVGVTIGDVLCAVLDIYVVTRGVSVFARKEMFASCQVHRH